MCPALVSGVQQMLSTDFVSTDFERVSIDFERGAERLVLLKGAKEGKNLELLPFNRRVPESRSQELFHIITGQ